VESWSPGGSCTASASGWLNKNKVAEMMVTNLFEDDGWLLLDRRNIPPPKEEKVSPASHFKPISQTWNI
jgi:hypothetical protein